jgi:hypothetical protein
VVIGGNMPKVKFLQDFQGKETGEIFYKLGQVADLPDHMTAILVADRRAELVKGITLDIEFENDPIATAETAPAVTDMTITDTPIYSEPDIAVETIEDVTTTEKVQPKRSKRGKK